MTNTEFKDMAYPTGNHAAANAIFLSNVRPKRTEGSDYELATTVDQIAAKQLGKETAIPSLELCTDLIAQVGNCDNGLACAYQNNLAWSSPTTPLPAEADPRMVFERLFGDGGSARRSRGRTEEESKHSRLGHRRHGAASKKSRRARTGRKSISTSIQFAKSNGAFRMPSNKSRRSPIADISSVRRACRKTGKSM